MPRFFFNHRSANGEHEVDIEGLKLPSLNSAVEEASFAAEGAVVLADNTISGVFEIEDEGRVIVARVRYANEDAAPAIVPSNDASPRNANDADI